MMYIYTKPLVMYHNSGLKTIYSSLYMICKFTNNLLYVMFGNVEHLIRILPIVDPQESNFLIVIEN